MRFSKLADEARQLGFDWREDDVIASLGEWAALMAKAERQFVASAVPDYDDEPEIDGWALTVESWPQWYSQMINRRRSERLDAG